MFREILESRDLGGFLRFRFPRAILTFLSIPWFFLLLCPLSQRKLPRTPATTGSRLRDFAFSSHMGKTETFSCCNQMLPSLFFSFRALERFLNLERGKREAASHLVVLEVGSLAPDIFYSQYVRPARPAGSSVDVHKSSYKKVAKFVDFLAKQDWRDIAKAGAEPQGPWFEGGSKSGRDEVKVKQSYYGAQFFTNFLVLGK